jgi:hypothetical protein
MLNPLLAGVLVHLVGLDHRVAQRIAVAPPPGVLLESATQFQPVLAVALQLAGQSDGGHALGDATEREHDLGVTRSCREHARRRARPRKNRHSRRGRHAPTSANSNATGTHPRSRRSSGSATRWGSRRRTWSGASRRRGRRSRNREVRRSGFAGPVASGPVSRRSADQMKTGRPNGPKYPTKSVPGDSEWLAVVARSGRLALIERF